MDILKIAEAFLHNLIGYDMIIIIMICINFWVLHNCKENANKVYSHFNRMDHTSNLTDESKEAISSGKTEVILTPNDLLGYRDKTNRWYAWFTNITSIFPLMGMLGTVGSLISMRDLIGSEVQGSFTEALTSTAWGIIAAVVFKMFDSSISFKIDDNEKHLEYLFNPKKGE